MEEKGGEAVACSGIDNDATKPPAKTGWSDEERVYLAHGYGEGVGAYWCSVRCGCRWLGDKRCVLWWGRGIGKLDFDIGVEGFS